MLTLTGGIGKVKLRVFQPGDALLVLTHVVEIVRQGRLDKWDKFRNTRIHLVHVLKHGLEGGCAEDTAQVAARHWDDLSLGRELARLCRELMLGSILT